MKRIMVVAALTALGGCGAMSATPDENSPTYMLKPGSRFVLTREITIPARSAHVTLQDGQPILKERLNQVNQYMPACSLEVRDRRDQEQTLQPDEFLVTRVNRQSNQTAARQHGPGRLWRVSNDGGPSMAVFVTIFDLKSDRQPQVRRLSCEHMDKIALGNHLSLSQIKTALGDYFTVKPVE